MFSSAFAKELYSQTPDKVYTYKGTWYAMFDDDLSILTNAQAMIRDFSYESKEEYRAIKRLIIANYDLEQMPMDSFDD